jgi:LEA14-like dessication related protein
LKYQGFTKWKGNGKIDLTFSFQSKKEVFTLELTKMKNPMRNCILLCFTLILFSSCSYEYPEVKGIRQVMFKSLSGDVLKVQINPVIHNPNPVPFWVDYTIVEVRLDKKDLGQSESTKRIDIKANGDSEFPLDLSIPVKGINLKQEIPKWILKDSILLEMDGKYTFKNSVKDVTVPYNYKTWIEPKKELARLLISF